MRLGFLILSGTLLLLAPCIVAEGKKQFWIVADVAPVRSQPNIKAGLVGNLRTGSSILGVKRSEDWIYVDSLYSLRSLPLRGWIQANMVSETHVDSAYILEQLSRSKTFADTLKWCERLVSLLPMNQEYMKALQKGYTAMGDIAKAAYFGRQIRGTNPVYLAYRDGKDLLVIGSLDSTGGFHRLLWKENPTDPTTPTDKAEQAIKKKAGKIIAHLSAMDWFPAGILPEFPEPAVHLATIPKIVQSPEYRGVYEDPMGMKTYGISLGAFYDDFKQYGESMLFATRPSYAVPQSGMTRRSELDSLPWYQKQLVGNAFDSGGATKIEYRKLHEYGYVEVVISGIFSENLRIAEQRGIFDPRRKRVWPPERTTGSDYWLKPLDLKAAPRWFRFGVDSSFPALIVLPFSTNISPPEFEEHEGEFGYQLLEISRTGMKTFYVRSD